MGLLKFFKKNKINYNFESFDTNEIYIDEHFRKDNSFWLARDKNIEIQGFKIANSLLYIEDSGRGSSLPHVVPLKLKAKSSSDFGDIGYWPSYSALSINQRGAFLKWLSEGKKDKYINIGYVFIYFYGLEYRAVKENKDLPLIAYELMQLRKIYKSNRSFDNYSEGLLSYILSKLDRNQAKNIFNEFIEPDLDKNSYIYESGIDLLVNNVNKISISRLISLIPSFQKTANSIIPYKVGNYFYDFFLKIANKEIEKAISNMSFKKVKRPYLSASLNLNQTKTYECLYLNLDNRIKNQLSKKWNQAIEDFRSYSRKISSAKPWAAFSLLPDQIKSTAIHPWADKLKEVELQFADKKLISLKELISILDFPVSGKLKKNERSAIVEALLSNNLIMEPNILYFNKPYSLDEKVYISKVEKAHMLKNDHYKFISAMADIGTHIAYADNDYSEVEAAKIYMFLYHEFINDEIESDYLRTRLHLYLYQKPNIQGVVKKLSETLNIKHATLFSEYLVQIALSDGNLCSNEDKEIKKILSKIGLNLSQIDNVYKKFNINIPFENQLIRKASTQNSVGSSIPSKTESESFSIDRNRLEQISKNRKKVRDMLSEFIEENEDADENETHEVASQIKEEKNTLNKPHEEFLSIVLEKNKWNKKDITKEAKKLGLMVNGAVSIINNWSNETFGDDVIFEENTFYYVSKEILGGYHEKNNNKTS